MEPRKPEHLKQGLEILRPWTNRLPPEEMTDEQVEIEIQSQRRRVSESLLNWLADQRFHRARWHRYLTELDSGNASSVAGLDDLLREINAFRDRFPYGFPPGKLNDAHVLQGRLGVLSYEIETLRAFFLHLNTSH